VPTYFLTEQSVLSGVNYHTIYPHETLDYKPKLSIPFDSPILVHEAYGGAERSWIDGFPHVRIYINRLISLFDTGGSIECDVICAIKK
jgi:hypothetical protein